MSDDRDDEATIDGYAPEGSLPPRHKPRKRPGSASVVVETAGNDHYRACRVEPLLDDVIQGEIYDYKAGLRAWIDAGLDPGGYAAGEDDRAIWSDGRLAAVLRPVADGGEPEVIRFDDPEEDQRPRPTTGGERHCWELVKHLGAAKARDALVAALNPEPAKAALTSDQEHVLTAIKVIGEDEVFDRLFLTGIHGVVGDTLRRLGSDAVAELRRLIDLGEPISAAPADSEG